MRMSHSIGYLIFQRRLIPFHLIRYLNYVFTVLFKYVLILMIINKLKMEIFSVAENTVYIKKYHV